jgi:acyl-homoserine lactone acylase PvdQ
MLKDKANAKELYDIDESLLYIKPRKERLETISRSTLKDDRSYRPPKGGSNCYAVHGNHTESGKAILACDPHLIKTINSVWYLTRISWNETDPETSENTVLTCLEEVSSACHSSHMLGVLLVLLEPQL